MERLLAQTPSLDDGGGGFGGIRGGNSDDGGNGGGDGRDDNNRPRKGDEFNKNTLSADEKFVLRGNFA